MSNFQEYFHNDKGLNALHFAAMIGEHELVKILFEKDMALNTKDLYGRTPLNFAAQNGHWLICLYLIEYGEEKNPSNENGKLSHFCNFMHGFSGGVKNMNILSNPITETDSALKFIKFGK